jgi:hypothetical protein
MHRPLNPKTGEPLPLKKGAQTAGKGAALPVVGESKPIAKNTEESSVKNMEKVKKEDK